MMTRRTALSLLAALPFASQALAQTRPRLRRVFCTSNLHYVLEPDGTVIGWTLDENGAAGWILGLGHNDRAVPYSAHAVAGLTNVVSVAIGDSTSFAVLDDGRVMAWGGNARGNLGNTPLTELEATAGPRATANMPIVIPELTNVTAVATHHDHALALRRDGTVYAWGWGQDGQLGIGAMPVINFRNHSPAAMAFVPYPVPVPALSDVGGVACGVRHSLALLKDGTIRAWGLNTRGQLGDGTTTSRPTPVVVTGIRTAVAVFAHSDNSAALLADGSVMTWGYGAALGRKPFNPNIVSSTPAPVAGVSGVRELAFADLHALALLQNGTIISWGSGNAGESGHTGVDPAPIGGLTNVQSIAATASRSFAVLQDGRVMTWGVVPLWARVFGNPGMSRFPIPLTLQGLRNP